MKNFVVKSFEARVSKVTTIDDLEAELERAKNCSTGISRFMRMNQENLSLAQKLELNEKHKDAQRVLKRLRHSFFDIEDELNGVRPKQILTA